MTTTHVPASKPAAPATRLTLIGYWAGSETTGSWPSPVDFVDFGWDEDDRNYIASYLTEGRVVWGCMGCSPCRFCGLDNGNLELSDGTYLWPSGLVHYLVEHGLRLPDEFVQHAYARTEGLEQADRDPEWWASTTPPSPRAAVAEAQTDGDEDPDPQDRTIVWPAERTARALPAIQGRHMVVDVVQELRHELASGPAEAWENDTLERFLDAFGELLTVVETSYVNTGRRVPNNPWALVARALRGATNYE